MTLHREYRLFMTRRQLFGRAAKGIGYRGPGLADESGVVFRTAC